MLHQLSWRTISADYDPATGPSDSAYTNIRSILQNGGASSTLAYMDSYWKDYQGQDESFWSHEWSKHGTCVSTIDPDCYTSYIQYEEVVDYFERAVALFKTLPTYDWLSAAGITPSTGKTYTLSQLQAVANSQFGHDVVWKCQNGALNEVWYSYVTRGNIVNGQFINSDPLASSNCPSTGIKYLPKGSASPTTTTSATGSTGTSGSSSNVNVINSSGTKQGCLISTGKWMVGATCAGYTSRASGSGFTLTTSKGPCAIVSGTFTCASGQTATVFTKDSSGNVLHSGGNTFYADSAPSGTTQNSVYTSSSNVSIKLRLG
ncbi:Ribonuclease T2 precursor (RNase T2) [Microbotryomycetes sp. JL201]|nr:Ribonuclease T2 precursor (RNase T2) [Microbotryomycetes sp. JL201]